MRIVILWSITILAMILLGANDPEYLPGYETILLAISIICGTTAVITGFYLPNNAYLRDQIKKLTDERDRAEKDKNILKDENQKLKDNLSNTKINASTEALPKILKSISINLASLSNEEICSEANEKARVIEACVLEAKIKIEKVESEISTIELGISKETYKNPKQLMGVRSIIEETNFQFTALYKQKAKEKERLQKKIKSLIYTACLQYKSNHEETAVDLREELLKRCREVSEILPKEKYEDITTLEDIHNIGSELRKLSRVLSNDNY